MSNIVGELARVRGAFDQPTLTLLHQQRAPIIIAIFRSSFSREVRSIPAGRLHTQVESYLDELAQSGETGLPTSSGRDLCLAWMRGQWLVRGVEDGEEVYSLTSHAQDALNLVTTLTRERATLSEHRIATIVSAVRRFNSGVNPDRASRVAILESEIGRLTQERDRLLAGEALEPVSDDYLLNGFQEILALVSALPSDFARVEEAFTDLRGRILASFRAELRPAGEVIDDYLKRADSLMTQTAEGRAFEGAFTLLRDEELLLQLREDLAALLDHPLAGEILISTEARELRGTVAVIRNGIEDVLAQRSRVSSALREYIATHDVSRDRELDAVLRAVDGELATWMASAGPRAVVPLPLLPARAEAGHLRERFYDPGNDVGPPPLVEVDEHRPRALSLSELIAQGGPSLAELRAQLQDALAGPDPVESLGVLFDGLAPELRRPVEIFGLLHLASNVDGLARQDDVEVYATRRPDGTARDLSVPRISPAAATNSEHDEHDEHDVHDDRAGGTSSAADAGKGEAR